MQPPGRVQVQHRVLLLHHHAAPPGRAPLYCRGEGGRARRPRLSAGGGGRSPAPLLPPRPPPGPGEGPRLGQDVLLGEPAVGRRRQGVQDQAPWAPASGLPAAREQGPSSVEKTSQGP